MRNYCTSTGNGSGLARGTRALGAFKQAVLVLRWFIDGARLVQLARDNGISTPTAYRYLHEGLTVLADHAPDLSTALERATAAGYTHLNLDGTVIRTDRVATPGPNKADLWWSGNTGTTVATSRSSPPRTAGRSGSPRSASGREHDTTCARTHGLVDALNRLAATLGIPTLTDLGYENAGPGFRHPARKPQGRELGLKQKTFNKVIRGIHGVAERANALFKVTFQALRRVSLDPGSITRIARAALALLQMEHGRTT
ncbi:transposase family protein [Streptomyces sp. NPDC005571]|uniref:transposase family protein n=1 Tax=Streptomyces sp. NPDC005571 TaxID=3156888 RepID=UPI0033A7E938